MTTPRGTDVIDQVWPYDGPHTPDTTREAAAALAHLTRYLSNAVQHAEVIAGGPDLGGVLARLAEANLPTLLQRLSWAADRIATDPTLYDDRRERPGASTATHVALVLDHDAGPAAETLAHHLYEAADLASHLGHDTTTTDDTTDEAGEDW